MLWWYFLYLRVDGECNMKWISNTILAIIVGTLKMIQTILKWQFCFGEGEYRNSYNKKYILSCSSRKSFTLSSFLPFFSHDVANFYFSVLFYDHFDPRYCRVNIFSFYTVYIVNYYFSASISYCKKLFWKKLSENRAELREYSHIAITIIFVITNTFTSFVIT